MHHEKNCTNIRFPITLAGLCYNITAIGLLCLGFLRGELASGLAGLLLLSYSFFSVILCLISIALWQSTQMQLVRKRNGTMSLSVVNHPNKTLSLLCGASLAVRYLRVNFPGKQAYFSLSLPVSGVYSQHNPVFPGQGVFIPVQQALILHDFACFFRFYLSSPAKNCCDQITLPAIPETPASRYTPAGATVKISGSSTFSRSENLYETRNYLPGDDPRRINWKIYAHSGSLAVREGELLPPPSAEFFCIFSMKTPSLPEPVVQNSFLSLVNRAATCLLDLLSRNRDITLVLRNSNSVLDPIRIDGTDPQKEEHLLQTLALLALSPEAPTPDECLSLIPPDATLLFFSLPDPPPDKLPRSRVHYFIGPYPVIQKNHSFPDKIKQVLIHPPARETVQKVFYPSDFHTSLSLFTAEGINAHIL